jgi:hypothetical protein
MIEGHRVPLRTVQLPCARSLLATVFHEEYMGFCSFWQFYVRDQPDVAGAKLLPFLHPSKRLIWGLLRVR